MRTPNNNHTDKVVSVTLGVGKSSDGLPTKPWCITYVSTPALVVANCGTGLENKKIADRLADLINVYGLDPDEFLSK